jgi:hypothetical protein
MARLMAMGAWAQPCTVARHEMTLVGTRGGAGVRLRAATRRDAANEDNQIAYVELSLFDFRISPCLCFISVHCVSWPLPCVYLVLVGLYLELCLDMIEPPLLFTSFDA